MNDLFKYLYHKYNRKPKNWLPFLSVYYITNACNFRCPYCCDGSGTPYYKLANNILPARDVLQILKNIRQHCKSLVITGGEPLNYPEIAEVISNLHTLKYKDIVLTTNGFHLSYFIEYLPRNITTLVISLDTLNEEKADKNYGNGKGVYKKIMENIVLANEYPFRHYDIYISSVVSPENIEDLYDVFEFSQKHNFTFAVAPQLQGVKANPNLITSNAYFTFYDFLIKEKKKNRKIFGSSLYLEYMRDLKKFECHPFTMLVVSPEGNVFYPCLEIGNFAGNILENNNLNKIKLNGLELFGPQPDCDTRCHSACALGFALLLKYPWSAMKETIS